MRSLVLILGLLLAYTFIYAGLSHFGTTLIASPASESTGKGG
jgi:uncharacterized membrane protein YphA (DoxX/SURF4 family)